MANRKCQDRGVTQTYGRTPSKECIGEVKRMACPYAEEIQNETVMVNLCEGHAYERGRDV